MDYRKEWEHEIHKRLLNDDPTASSELAEVLLPLLVESLKKSNRSITDRDLINHAVFDALISYIKRPAQFNPEKKTLFGYLKMSASGDLKNILSKASSQKKYEIPVESVELVTEDRNITVDDVSNSSRRLESEEVSETFHQIIKENFTDKVDLKIIDLLLLEERSTEAFAEVLGITHLEKQNQSALVKRNKDRIKVKLKRLKKRFYEDV